MTGWSTSSWQFHQGQCWSGHCHGKEWKVSHWVNKKWFFFSDPKSGSSCLMAISSTVKIPLSERNQPYLVLKRLSHLTDRLSFSANPESTSALQSELLTTLQWYSTVSQPKGARFSHWVKVPREQRFHRENPEDCSPTEEPSLLLPEPGVKARRTSWLGTSLLPGLPVH